MFQKLLSPKWVVVLNVVLIALVSVTLVSAHGSNNHWYLYGASRGSASVRHLRERRAVA